MFSKVLSRVLLVNWGISIPGRTLTSAPTFTSTGGTAAQLFWPSFSRQI